MDVIRKAFPPSVISEGVIRKVLKTCADFKREGEEVLVKKRQRYIMFLYYSVDNLPEKGERQKCVEGKMKMEKESRGGENLWLVHDVYKTLWLWIYLTLWEHKVGVEGI